QYTAEDYAQVLDDHHVLASVGTVGDCYDNALAESLVDSYKTELIADRVWQTNAQLELATVAYVGWFNHRRLHSSIGNRPPVEHEHEYWERAACWAPLKSGTQMSFVSAIRGEDVTREGCVARSINDLR
ncbi:MAG: integrase core domain-containing protein, partial [Solirubrobacteraceae bacterium]